MGDLAPHMINAALALIGLIKSLVCYGGDGPYRTSGGKVTNDDQAQMMCRFVKTLMRGQKSQRDGALCFQPRRNGPQNGLRL